MDTSTYAAWFAGTDFKPGEESHPDIIRIYERSKGFDASNFVVKEGHRPIFVRIANVGPCGWKHENGEYCRRPIASLMYLNGQNKRYEKTVHADDGTVHGKWWFDCNVISACPKCKTEDSLTTRLEAYGDLTTCKTEGCDYTSWYDIGD
jgi:hypothetical protein